jgi:hypothetical protein
MHGVYASGVDVMLLARTLMAVVAVCATSAEYTTARLRQGLVFMAFGTNT